ncbi:GNAT family N-acetyltransferase [Clostridium psychrophilum]|uniref:GNAT family N-acetyltransferase n=1 Tax=Clostridium psychrophilum TaxID=132926 RepID=UPI001C0D1276|nr:GNAT family N-acetyltransferase [Clostridium psychrophilum]MBU3182591.1 GNAT family N-acetyltransferase [Clostridium psychrophilum]
MKIIKLHKNNITNALDLVWRVFQEFEAPDYSEQGIEEFRKFISYNSIIEQFDTAELYLWGCIDNNDLTGVIATRGINHICMMFVNKEYHRQGIARSLFQTVEERCKSVGNIKKITVNSSPYAIKVYHHLGFINIDEELNVNGIRFTPMSYLLK